MTSEPEAAATAAERRPRVRQGLVIVNTGEGKGKTTAALGVMFRAWGRDFRTRMFQFIKTAGARFGEHRAAERIGIPIEAGGDGCTIRSKDTAQAAALAAQQWERCKEAILSGNTTSSFSTNWLTCCTTAGFRPQTSSRRFGEGPRECT